MLMERLRWDEERADSCLVSKAGVGGRRVVLLPVCGVAGSRGARGHRLGGRGGDGGPVLGAQSLHAAVQQQHQQQFHQLLRRNHHRPLDLVGIQLSRTLRNLIQPCFVGTTSLFRCSLIRLTACVLL